MNKDTNIPYIAALLWIFIICFYFGYMFGLQGNARYTAGVTSEGKPYVGMEWKF